MYRRWDGSAGAWVLDEAVETLERQQLELPPLSSRPEDLNAWASANPPPCRDDFATQELFDAAREPWYVLLMGTRLPPYGQNAKRAKAWGRACMQDSERSASHRSRRSVPRSWQKSLLPLPAREDTFRVRTSVAAACAGHLGRASSSKASRRS